MIAMPDVKIICVNSAERELRFYDIAINKFELRMRVSRKIAFFLILNVIVYFFYFRYTVSKMLLYV